MLSEAVGLEQNVTGPTHVDGQTLDLVVSNATDGIIQTCRIGDFLSDHSIIHISLNAASPLPTPKKDSIL